MSARAQALSPSHVLAFMETSFGPLKRLVAALRGEIVRLIEPSFRDNVTHQDFLMTGAMKKTP